MAERVMGKSEPLSNVGSLRIPESFGQKDYNQYSFIWWEAVLYFLSGIFIIAVLSYIFYKSWVAALIFLLFFPFYFRFIKKRCVEKQKSILRNQYKELLIAVLTNLQAGYSIENSFVEAYQDMSLIYSENTYICKELIVIRNGLTNNKTLEELLENFADRSGVEEIKEFSTMFRIAKRSGGNLPEILKNCTGMITEKMEVKQEIITTVSAKRMESNIMCMIPLIMVLYVDITSPGFLDVLYHNLFGVCTMSVCLGVYLSGFLLAQKIVQVKV